MNSPPGPGAPAPRAPAGRPFPEGPPAAAGPGAQPRPARPPAAPRPQLVGDGTHTTSTARHRRPAACSLRAAQVELSPRRDRRSTVTDSATRRQLWGLIGRRGRSGRSLVGRLRAAGRLLRRACSLRACRGAVVVRARTLRWGLDTLLAAEGPRRSRGPWPGRAALAAGSGAGSTVPLSRGCARGPRARLLRPEPAGHGHYSPAPSVLRLVPTEQAATASPYAAPSPQSRPHAAQRGWIGPHWPWLGP